MSSSGCRTYGTISSFGCLVQADAPASAIDAPMRRKKRRRDAESFQSGVRLGNSSSTKARNSSVEASSSKLRQYMGWLCVISSPVACHAVGQALNLVFLYQARPQLRLAVRILVGDVEHLIPRPNILRRIAMALDAPLHIKRVHFVHQRHPVHPAVTG